VRVSVVMFFAPERASWQARWLAFVIGKPHLSDSWSRRKARLTAIKPMPFSLARLGRALRQ